MFLDGKALPVEHPTFVECHGKFVIDFILSKKILACSLWSLENDRVGKDPALCELLNGDVGTSL